jgi:hypothetical protein
MAMERPKPRIVGVEGDHDPAPGWHQHGVAHRAGKPPAVDFDDLKLAPVQVHRMRPFTALWLSTPISDAIGDGGRLEIC